MSEISKALTNANASRTFTVQVGRINECGGMVLLADMVI
jgi:hypothetical protein